jgi:hypothetical protein
MKLASPAEVGGCEAQRSGESALGLKTGDQNNADKFPMAINWGDFRGYSFRVSPM